jgi:hypothetical protein
MNFISIGESCQTAYQIRRYFDVQERYIFDWVISNLESVEKLLLNIEGKDILNEDSIEVVENGLRLLDKKTLIKHQHDFTLENNRHNIDVVRCELDSVRRKYVYLLNKTINYIENFKPVFVFYDWRKNKGSLSKLCELREEISKRFSYDAQAIYVTELPIDNEALGKVSVHYASIDNSRVKGTKYMWRGCDKAWDDMFDGYLGNGRPQ